MRFFLRFFIGTVRAVPSVKTGKLLLRQVRDFKITARRKAIRRPLSAHQFHAIISRQPRSLKPGLCTFAFWQVFIRTGFEGFDILGQKFVIRRFQV